MPEVSRTCILSRIRRKLIRISSSTRFCSQLWKKDIPRLYPGEEKNVILHFDSASSHTTPAVYAYLKKKKVKYISKEDWPSNSLDLSPMDFSGNGTFKKAMFTRKPETIAGLQKIAREVWKEFPETICYNTMKAWPGRVQKMLQNNGFQIENMKNDLVCFWW